MCTFHHGNWSNLHLWHFFERVVVCSSFSSCLSTIIIYEPTIKQQYWPKGLYYSIYEKTYSQFIIVPSPPAHFAPLCECATRNLRTQTRDTLHQVLEWIPSAHARGQHGTCAKRCKMHRQTWRHDESGIGQLKRIGGKVYSQCFSLA